MIPKSKAQAGWRLLNEAILDLLANHPNGLGNAEIADQLEIRSNYLGKSKDFLSWSLLGMLLNEEKIVRDGKKYRLP